MIAPLPIGWVFVTGGDVEREYPAVALLVDAYDRTHVLVARPTATKWEPLRSGTLRLAEVTR